MPPASPAKKARDRIHARKQNLVKRRGISVEDYDARFDAQQGLCGICAKPETVKSKLGRVFGLAVDHCHRTGKVRGLLCQACNTALGKACDDPHLLRAMAEYIELHQAA